MLQNEQPFEFTNGYNPHTSVQNQKKKFSFKALIAIAVIVVVACASFLIVNEIQKNNLQKKLMRCDWYSYHDGYKYELEFDEYYYEEVFASLNRLFSRSTYKPVSGSKIKVTEIAFDSGSPIKVNQTHKITFNSSMTEFTMTYNGNSETWHKD